jgi:hypothetical protein
MIGDSLALRATRYGVTLSDDNIPRTALRLYGVIERKTPDGVPQFAQTSPKTQSICANVSENSGGFAQPEQAPPKTQAALLNLSKRFRKLRQLCST